MSGTATRVALSKNMLPAATVATSLSTITLVSCAFQPSMCIFMAMHSQPIPSVTWTDVEVLVRRDYSGDHFSEVFSILKEYEKHSSDEDPSRVQVAVLKLAHGNVERLRLHVKAATFDRRDVVLAAQYPEYLKNGFPVEALPSQRKGRDKRTTEKGTGIR
jgi:hypothetical protein